MLLENNMVKNSVCEPVHLSRIIASWRNAGGKRFGSDFEEWLKSIGIDENTTREAIDMAILGKMELEKDAMRFLRA